MVDIVSTSSLMDISRMGSVHCAWRSYSRQFPVFRIGSARFACIMNIAVSTGIAAPEL